MSFEKIHENMGIELKQNNEYNELSKNQSEMWTRLYNNLSDENKKILNELDSINISLENIELRHIYKAATSC